MKALSSLWNSLQRRLLPALEDELGELTPKQQEFVRICERCRLDQYIGPYTWKGEGRRPEDRLATAKAFVAKSVYNLPTTKALIEYVQSNPSLRRLCGWESVGALPSESAFSRAFHAFAEGGLPQGLHEAMIKAQYQEKVAGHLSRDSSAIKAREKPKKVSKPSTAKGSKKKRGRPKKGAVREAPPKTKIQLQSGRSLEENLADLPRLCNWGKKRTAKEEWKRGGVINFTWTWRMGIFR